MFGRALVSPTRALLLEERARIMRCNPPRSEERLWRRLSGSKTGFAFRRQLVIGEHIVDFACTKVRLVVEVDGATTSSAADTLARGTARSTHSGGACCGSVSMRSSKTLMRSLPTSSESQKRLA